MSSAGPFAATLESLFAEFVNTLTNATLSLDPLSGARLQALQGRCVHLVIQLPAVADRTFSLLVNDGKLEIAPYPVPEPNAIARGTLVDLLGWVAGGAGTSGTISFEGDETVLQELSDIFRRYRPDLSEPVAGLLGSEVAENLLNVAEGAIAALRSAAQGAGSALQRGTAQRYVTRTSMNAFLDVLDDTRARVDRLAQRVQAEESRPRSAGADGNEQ